jgi:CTP-dependent riboflavin kinase
MRKRQIEREEKDNAAFSALAEDTYLSADEVARRIKRSRQAVAHALRRLCEQQKVERIIVKVHTKSRFTEDLAKYRIPGVSKAIFASWLKPQIPQAFKYLPKRTVKLLE